VPQGKERPLSRYQQKLNFSELMLTTKNEAAERAIQKISIFSLLCFYMLKLVGRIVLSLIFA